MIPETTSGNRGLLQAEPLDGYEPDNFILQPGEGSDQLVGALSSATSATVTFNRLR